MKNEIGSSESIPSSDELLSDVRTRSSSHWSEVQARTQLELFHSAAARVPAYKDFLDKNNINPEKITSSTDLLSVPPTSKTNYLREYPMQALCWDGELCKPFVFSATSGSTGKPFYFPHGPELDWQYSILADLFLEQGPVDGPRLVIITFGMGVWIGGLFTFQAFELASQRGKNISILTPGVNKAEILHALRDLAPNFAQTIIIGYPPFVKDVLDDAAIEGIDLTPLHIRLLFAAEGFTEKFRDHIVRMAGVSDPHLDTLNIYGTADIGAMAYETPISILTRRLALSNESFFSSLFEVEDKTPTLAQYNPTFTSFEAVDGEILLTGNNAMPLLRYMVGDKGGVRTFSDIEQRASDAGIDLRDEAARLSVPIYELPSVFVYERADFSTKLYGAIMYPEHVREALQDETFQQSVTGRFTMQTKTDERHDQYLEIHIELREHQHESSTLGDTIQQTIVRALLARNSEYRNNHASMKEKVFPKIVFWPHEDPKYFKPTIKQKWVIKD